MNEKAKHDHSTKKGVSLDLDSKHLATTAAVAVDVHRLHNSDGR